MPSFIPITLTYTLLLFFAGLFSMIISEDSPELLLFLLLLCLYVFQASRALNGFKYDTALYRYTQSDLISAAIDFIVEVVLLSISILVLTFILVPVPEVLPFS